MDEKNIIEAEYEQKEMHKEANKTKGLGHKFKIGTLVSYLVFGTVCSFGGGYAATKFMETQTPTTNTADVVQEQPNSVQQVVYVDQNGYMTYAQTAAQVKQSVVEIQTETVQRSSFYGQYVASGAGSGVIYSSDGYIITNNHVVEDASNITVILNDGTKYEAKLIGTDSRTDLAIIKIEANGLPTAKLGDSDTLAIGEEVIAVGNPLGELGGSVSEGIISAKDREIQIDGSTMVLLQTTAAINPGNSGGGLFNLKGELIGIVNAKSSGTTSSGSTIEGIGFAIPISGAKKIISDLIENGYVTGRAMLGIQGIEISDYYSAMRYGVNQLGIYVADVTTKNGLEKGDLIVQINDTMITCWADLSNYLDNSSIGDTLDVVVYRNGKQKTVKVTLIEYKPSTN